MEQIWNKNDERLSWFVFKMWRFTVSNVFEKYENNSLKTYGLCPSHYLNAPAFSWDTSPNMTKIKLQLIWVPDMYIIFGKGIRGGVSYISNRYGKANNKYLKSHDPK